MIISFLSCCKSVSSTSCKMFVDVQVSRCTFSFACFLLFVFCCTFCLKRFGCFLGEGSEEFSRFAAFNCLFLCTRVQRRDISCTLLYMYIYMYLSVLYILNMLHIQYDMYIYTVYTACCIHCRTYIYIYIYIYTYIYIYIIHCLGFRDARVYLYTYMNCMAVRLRCRLWFRVSHL